MTTTETPRRQRDGGPDVPEPKTGDTTPSVSLGHLAERYALVVVLAALCGFFGVWSETGEVFRSTANIRNIVGNETVNATLVLAALLPLTTGQFDLSVGSIAGAASIATATMTSDFGWPVLPAVMVGVALGAIIGLANGVIVARLQVNPLIATLGMATLVGGLVSWYTDNQVIVTGIPESLVSFGNGTWFGVPRPTIVVISLAVGVHVMLEHTPFGRHLGAVGSNRNAAHLVGLSVDRLITRSFVLSGALSGAAGVLLLARSGNANPQVGSGFTLAALSACFLGATAIKPGFFNVVGAFVGVLLVAVSVNGLVLAGADAWVQPVFNGASLIVAVVASGAIARHRSGT